MSLKDFCVLFQPKIIKHGIYIMKEFIVLLVFYTYLSTMMTKKPHNIIIVADHVVRFILLVMFDYTYIVYIVICKLAERHWGKCRADLCEHYEIL